MRFGSVDVLGRTLFSRGGSAGASPSRLGAAGSAKATSQSDREVLFITDCSPPALRTRHPQRKVEGQSDPRLRQLP